MSFPAEFLKQWNMEQEHFFFSSESLGFSPGKDKIMLLFESF